MQTQVMLHNTSLADFNDTNTCAIVKRPRIKGFFNINCVDSQIDVNRSCFDWFVFRVSTTGGWEEKSISMILDALQTYRLVCKTHYYSIKAPPLSFIMFFGNRHRVTFSSKGSATRFFWTIHLKNDEYLNSP